MKSKGFTIIELLVVMGIMAIMLGLSIAAFHSSVRGSSVNTGTSHIMNTLAMARAKAITERARVRVVFADGSNTNGQAQSAQSYAICISTNQSTQAEDISANATSWVYEQNWKSLPPGAFFDSLPTVQRYCQFPTNGGSVRLMTCLEFRPDGSCDANWDVGLQEGTVVNGAAVISNSNNRATVRLSKFTGVAKKI